MVHFILEENFVLIPHSAEETRGRLHSIVIT
jgi:hypothetical protein